MRAVLRIGLILATAAVSLATSMRRAEVPALVALGAGAGAESAPPAVAAATKGDVTGYLRAYGEHQALARASTIGGAWQSIGPGPLIVPRPVTTTATGRAQAFAYAPLSHTLYVGTIGGVWKSRDEGATYTPLTDTMPSPAIRSLAVDPNDSQSVYAGTGDYVGIAASRVGVGVYVSHDGGTTWRVTGTSIFSDAQVNALAVDPEHPGRVYAAYWSNPSGPSSGGLAVSTNAGTTWKRLTAPQVRSKPVYDLQIDVAGNLFATVGGSIADAGVYLSRDGGRIWQRRNHGLGDLHGLRVLRIAAVSPLAHRKPETETLYLVVSGRSAVSGTSLEGVYRTTNGGGRWRKIGDAKTLGEMYDQGPYDMYVSVDPNDKTGNTAYVGLAALYRVSDAGSPSPRWACIAGYFECSPNYAGSRLHIDQQAMIAVGQKLFFANDGGVYTLPSGGTIDDIEPANGNLSITQFNAGTIDRSGSSIAAGGTQDNGLVARDVEGRWAELSGGDQGVVALDPRDPQRIYVSRGNRNLEWTSDGGTTWHVVSDPPVASDPVTGAGIAPIVISPDSSDTLYLGLSHLYRSTDSAATWHDLTPDIPPTAIRAVAVAPSDPSTIYIGDVGRHVWRTTDRGRTWVSLDGMACTKENFSPYWCLMARLKTSQITSIAVDPHNAETLYVTLGGPSVTLRPAAVALKSTDGGRTWVEADAGLPLTAFSSAAVDPANPLVVVAGSAFGVYVSTDGGLNWSVLGTGFPVIAVVAVEIDHAGQDVTAFTAGRGAWRIALP